MIKFLDYMQLCQDGRMFTFDPMHLLCQLDNIPFSMILVATRVHCLNLADLDNDELVCHQICAHLLKHTCLLINSSRGYCPKCETDSVQSIDKYQISLLKSVIMSGLKVKTCC